MFLVYREFYDVEGYSNTREVEEVFGYICLGSLFSKGRVFIMFYNLFF